MTNRYSQWRWGGLSGNWSISPAPKISSLKPHHSIKALHWSPIDPPSTWTSFAQAFITIDEGQTTSTVINMHYLIWFVISGVWMRSVTVMRPNAERIKLHMPEIFFTVIASNVFQLLSFFLCERPNEIHSGVYSRLIQTLVITVYHEIWICCKDT